MIKKTAFSYIVLILSLANIFNHLRDIFSLSVGLSLIGIMGFVAFMLKMNIYKTLFPIWILLQFPSIYTTVIENGISHAIPTFDLSQAIRVKFGIGLFYIPKAYNIGINIVPFGFFFLYKFLKNNNLISSEVQIFPIRENSPIAPYSPLAATIIDTEKESLIAELSRAIEIEEKQYHKIIFSTVDKSHFKLNKKRQKCEINLVCNLENEEIQTEGFIS